MASAAIASGRRTVLGSGGFGDCRHRLDVGAGEAADDRDVESRVGGQGGLSRISVGGRDADGPLGLAEAVEVVAVAVVEVAVKGLLLGEALGGVVADRDADVAEDRRRCRRRRPRRSRAPTRRNPASSS